MLLRLQIAVWRRDRLNIGGRSTAQGYLYGSGLPDLLRHKFTGSYERDDETGLDYAKARYYANIHGRFTSPDPLLSSGKPVAPQSWNRYAYCLNNPLLYIDPTGLEWRRHDKDGTIKWYKEGDNRDGSTELKFSERIYEAVDGSWIRLDWNGPRQGDKGWEAYASFGEALEQHHGSLGDNSTVTDQAFEFAAGEVGGRVVTNILGNIGRRLLGKFLARGATEAAEDGGNFIYRTISKSDPHYSQFENIGDSGFINPRGGHNDLTLHVQEGQTNSIFTSWSRSQGANWAQWGEPGSIQLRLDTVTMQNHALDVSRWSNFPWEREVTVIGPVKGAVRVR